MNSNQMKNMIVLKDLPSNLIDEAFIILKNNKKIKSLERINKKTNTNKQTETSREYIVKEAEMVISNYLSKIEQEKQIKSFSIKQIENKYKRLKAITKILSSIIIIDVILNIIVRYLKNITYAYYFFKIMIILRLTARSYYLTC